MNCVRDVVSVLTLIKAPYQHQFEVQISRSAQCLQRSDLPWIYREDNPHA